MTPLPSWVPWVAVATVGLGGFAVGRYATAPQVEVREVERVEWRTREVVKVEWREKVVEKRVIVRVTESSDAGTRVTERIEEGVRTDRDGSGSEDRVLEGMQEREMTVTATHAQWRVGVDVGASLREPLLPLYGPLVVGVRAERWVAGPVWLGAWASTSGAAGVGVTAEF